MTYPRTTLVVLTLLQLCRAEISDKQPESWYAANVINDEFQPKPISEIFTTEASFSSTNPIIILSKSEEIPNEIALLSTLPPPTRIQTSTKVEGFSSMPPKIPIPSTSTQTPPVSITTQSTPAPTSSTTPSQIKTTQQETTTPEAITPNIQAVPAELQPVLPLLADQPIIPPSPPEVPQAPIVTLPVLPVIQPVPPLQQLDPPVPQSVQPIVRPTQTNSTQLSRSQSAQTQSQQIRLELIPQVQTFPNLPVSNPPDVQVPQFVTQVSIPQTSTSSPQSNYFLIYQQAPQNIQNFPLPPVTSIAPSQIPLVSVETSQPTNPQPAPTISLPSIPSSPPQTVPPIMPTSSSPSSLPQTVPQLISTTSIPSPSPQTIPPTISTTSNPSLPAQTILPKTVITMSTLESLPNTTIPTRSTVFNSQNTASLLPTSRTTPTPRPLRPVSSYPLRIRVIAPPGSITNVKINPTTTTKKPKTPRTRKPKPKARKNTYDVCIDSCKGRRDPICAGPISPGVIDSNTLKGFPSICHMACHNSFRKDAYEKIVDGRCGKLRTRIRTVDSNKKLKRDELNKAQYTLDNTGSRTIVEISGSIN